MDRHQLGPYQLTRNEKSNDLLLLVKGPTVYKAILDRALPALQFSRTFPDRFGLFDWGTYIRGADSSHQAELDRLCCLLQLAILIDDDLDESFALSFHTQMSPTGGYERTRIGQLVRIAKPYDRNHNSGDRVTAEKLASELAQFISQHPTYRRADLITAVPPSNANKPFDLPIVLVQEIAKITGITVAPTVAKSRKTRPMKECRTVQEKVDNLSGVFSADCGVFGRRTVILVDDIYETGFTINEVGRALKTAGATLVLGLVATKTARDLSGEPARKEEEDDIPT